ncbi:putative methyl-accepting chemotaxis protein [Phaeobacter inhibens]|uniref:Methyl-accepting chemotaxis protein n=1 Tax=Phaeobacter inhibens TaxID=221822 RepID=A0ABM6RAW8_9RHOB|nr:methyl-accepting chemotaxis protein [Phaeobacter inhibens]AUQ48890.1 putative methyl-accepting chemotaxis protein [Phaeobacter inhibens]AUQ93390.1 putative methyl-accepting chemotaxis protein [Phaeobacter inhibens]AUR18693.1 putative methyl-accepting chemotaxis protein [Phaeobacter inhibens]
MLRSISISNRINAGFAALTVLLVALAGLSLVVVRDLGESYLQYRATAKQSIATSDFVEDLFQARIAALKYRATRSEESSEEVQSNISEIIRDGNDLTVFSENAAYSRDIEAAVQSSQQYLAYFEDLRAAVAREEALEHRALELGKSARKNLTELSITANKSHEGDLQYLTSRAQENLLLSRIYVEKYFLSRDSAHFEEANAYITAAIDSLPRVVVLSSTQEEKDLAESASEEIALFQEQLAEIQVAITQVDEISARYLDKIGPEMQNSFERLAESIVATQNELGPNGQAIVDRMFVLVPVVGLLCTAIAVLLSVTVGRWIVVPLRQAIKTTNRLGQGKTDVDIVGAEQRHELGQLAQALVVFRQAHLDRDRIAQERENRAREEQADVVNALSEGLELLADGTLSARINETFPEEYDALRVNFNAAMEKLQAAIQSVVSSTESIRSGASEINQSSSELSMRTETQAATLAQTAAALATLTDTVQSTASGAEKANAYASETKRSAEESGEVLEQTITAMAEIRESSEKISQIISVINDIAFQTNLLALNAGVEAARAGEAGRGFAVVASEVRALAQRASSASDEIEGLISNSSQHVQDGVSLVEKTFGSLKQMIEKITSVNGLVEEIAGATKEQSTGISEINTAITQLDGVTQQNAAMVEETTAAAQMLDTDANTLNGLTAVFSLTDGAAARFRRKDEADGDKGSIFAFPEGNLASAG